MSDCFSSAQCTISFAGGSSVVEWTLHQSYAGYGVSVFRSPDGLGSWELVNKDALLFGGRCEDPSIGITDKLHQLTYRLDCEPHDSQGRPEDVAGSCLVTPLDIAVLSRGELPTIRRMIMSEIIRLRRGAGVPCWIYAPLVHGAGDPVALTTGMLTSVPCPAHDTRFGTFYDHGFAAPFQTWVQLRQQQNSNQARSDGLGSIEQVVLPIRLPAFPYIRKGYLIVLPGSDRRFVTTDSQTPRLYRGLVPVAFDAEVHELSRQDPRYRVPVPEFDPRLTAPAYFK